MSQLELLPAEGHLIAGELVTEGEKYDVIDPCTENVVGQAPSAGSVLVDGAMNAAASALDAWASDEVARRAALLRAADTIEQSVEQLRDVLCLESGKPAQSAAFEVMGAAAHLRWYANAPLPQDVLHDDENQKVVLVRDPVGVVVAITPWNGPLVMLANKLGAALLVGNTVVAKPSPFTPVSSLLLGRLIADIFPPGVVNILSGGDDLGRALVAHSATRLISFTGSVNAGRAIMASAASDLKRVCLELGGNDAAIVLGDVDPEVVAPRLFRGAFMATGQICAAVKRLYVHESLFDAVVDQLAGIASATRLGTPHDPETTMGPLTTRPQYERVRALVENALAAGGKAHSGGAPADGPGYFYPPTVITGVDTGVELVDSEQFGPVLPVIPFSDVDEAIEKANGTNYGLGGSIWTSDIAAGTNLAKRLRSGTAWVNRHPAVGPDLPFGGIKHSGLGRENGAPGIDHYSELKTLSVDYTPTRKDQ